MALIDQERDNLTRSGKKIFEVGTGGCNQLCVSGTRKGGWAHRVRVGWAYPWQEAHTSRWCRDTVMGHGQHRKRHTGSKTVRQQL